MPIKVLIVDDEPMIIKGLRFSLEQDNYIVDEALDGETALEMAMSNKYDIMLLDVMLPKLSGTEVLRQIRDTSDMPVIMLTAKGEDMDRILGLEYGADDYIVKPFNILEVKARIRTILRRSMRKSNKSETLNLREIELDPARRSVMRSGKDINLTAKEFSLLHMLMVDAGKVFSREELLNSLWNVGDESSHDLRTVDVHIRRLREKLERNPAKPAYIKTKWGVGYYFALD